jgi:hypothetical protein
MRTPDEIQSDIRELRRQYDATNIKVTKHSAAIAHADVRLDRRRAELLLKIKEYSQEYLAVLKVNQY